jgi:hypothetical protein
VDTVAETLARAHTLPGAYYFTTIGMRIYPDTPLWHLLAPENRGETRADYLPQPRFHLAPGFTVGGLYRQLEEVQREHPNWIVGDPPPEFLTTIQKLRSRGLRGPLWEYIETLRRLQAPQVATDVLSHPVGHPCSCQKASKIGMDPASAFRTQAKLI